MKLPLKVQDFIHTFEKNGYLCYAVGGSVRDTLMDKPTKGWDFTTNATPEEIIKLFPDSFYDNSFGTVGVKIYKDNTKKEPYTTDDEIEDIFEVTTFRSETGYSDKRHPDVVTWGTNLEGDLARRDFSINAIATNGVTFTDPYNGQKDIQNKIVRAVGDPNKRFQEDSLRLMRAIRISTELGFSIEDETRQAITKNAALISNVSFERIHDELLRILKSPYCADGILLLKNTGLLHYIIPEFDSAFDIEQKSPKRHHLYDVGTHSVMALKNCPSKDPIVRFATLIHDIGKPATFKKSADGLITFYNHEVTGTKIARTICSRLRFSKKDTDKILTLIRWHQFSVDERQTDSAIRRIIRRVGKENMEDMLALRTGDRLGGGALETSWRLELFKKRLVDVQKQPFSIKDLKINGVDVMQTLTIKPGPRVGSTLQKLFNEVEEGTLKNEKDELLKRLKELSHSL